jgi:hypothetical protein
MLKNRGQTKMPAQGGNKDVKSGAVQKAHFTLQKNVDTEILIELNLHNI